MDLGTGYITIIMFGLLLLLLGLGTPMAFALGGIGTIVGLLFLGDAVIAVIPILVLYKMQSFVTLAIPLFVFMAVMLERSGIAEDLYGAMYKMMGPLRGGLAMGTVLICTLFAAMSGVSAAATITMGLIALPSMMKRGYGKDIALGGIMAGGALGVLIPPSVLMVLIGEVGYVSVGNLFIGGIIPGLILSTLFNLYIGGRAFLQPHIGPPLPREERASWSEKFVALRGVILPILLVILVLGSIFGVIASVTEAAGVGAFGAVLCAAIYRKLNWQNFKETSYQTIRTSAMIMWIVFGAAIFNSVYTALGSQQFIQELLSPILGRPLLAIIAMQVIMIFLGMFLEPVGIILIVSPIFFPIIRTMGFDPVWFGVIMIVNLQLGYLSPPFGPSLFYLRSVVPKDITMSDIYHSVWPFLGCQAIGLSLVVAFPWLVLWLPGLMFK